jgi:5'-nucleotidase / UDP-sugar diphosphatase
LMKQICFDAFCLGNHVRVTSLEWSISCVVLLLSVFLNPIFGRVPQEFDEGDSNLASFITALHGTNECATAVLGANVVPGETSPLRALQESGDLEKSLIVDFDNNEQVGIIGISIRNKTLASSRPDAGTTLLDERETAMAEVKALTDAGVNKIILLTHIGYDLDLAWMVDIPGVDIIVGGDSHTLLGTENGVFNAEAPYPGVQSSVDGRTVCVVQAWEFAHGLGQLNVEFDDDGEVVVCQGFPVFPIGTPELSDAAEAAEVTAYLVGLGESFVPVEEDEATMMELQGFTGQLAKLLVQTIATVPADICFERIPGQGRSKICPVEASATQGGGVCNIVAQAFLSRTLEADVAIQNAGG